MERFDIGLIGIASVLVLILTRMPVGIVLALVSFAGIWAVTNLNAALGMLRAVPYQFVANWSFSAVPMFLLMGYIASNAGLTKGLFRTMRIMLHRVPGGLACSAVGASALFAAASGSSVATSAGMGKIAVPEMQRAGYDKGLATGCVAAAGTLGSLIPPSVVMVIYGVFTQQSISKLFMAGFIPGLLTALVYMAMIITRVKLRPSLAPRSAEQHSRSELVEAIKEVWPLPMLIAGVIGGIYLGVMTPTEAGAVGAALAVVIALARGSFSLAMLRTALRETAIGTSSLFVIAMGASMFTTFMGLAGLPNEFANIMMSISSDPLVLLLIISLIYIVLGCFMDSIGVMLITLPILLPLLEGANIDLIWFGIIVVKLLEIGMITPPLGLNVFVIHSAMNGTVPLTTVFRGVMWFIAMEIVVLALLIAFPEISLWLPGQMK